MNDLIVIVLVLLVFNTATFAYLTHKVTSYMDWKRHWRETRNV